MTAPTTTEIITKLSSLHGENFEELLPKICALTAQNKLTGTPEALAREIADALRDVFPSLNLEGILGASGERIGGPADAAIPQNVQPDGVPDGSGNDNTNRVSRSKQAASPSWTAVPNGRSLATVQMSRPQSSVSSGIAAEGSKESLGDANNTSTRVTRSRTNLAWRARKSTVSRSSSDRTLPVNKEPNESPATTAEKSARSRKNLTRTMGQSMVLRSSSDGTLLVNKELYGSATTIAKKPPRCSRKNLARTASKSTASSLNSNGTSLGNKESNEPSATAAEKSPVKVSGESGNCGMGRKPLSPRNSNKIGSPGFVSSLPIRVPVVGLQRLHLLPCVPQEVPQGHSAMGGTTTTESGHRDSGTAEHDCGDSTTLHPCIPSNLETTEGRSSVHVSSAKRKDTELSQESAVISGMSDDTGVHGLDDRQGPRHCTSVRPRKRRPNLPFTELEEEAIVYGVQKYSKETMLWKRIHMKGNFVDRTTSDIRDKHRNLQKSRASFKCVEKRVAEKLKQGTDPLEELRNCARKVGTRGQCPAEAPPDIKTTSGGDAKCNTGFASESSSSSGKSSIFRALQKRGTRIAVIKDSSEESAPEETAPVGKDLPDEAASEKDSSDMEPVRQDSPIDDSPSGPTGSRRVRKKRKFFSDEEIDALVDGVMMYGLGSWMMIKRIGGFHGRKSTDLSDKYRNLAKSKENLAALKEKVQKMRHEGKRPLETLKTMRTQD